MNTSLPGVVRLEPEVFSDSRGFFLETFHKRKYEEGGIDQAFVQDNHSHSKEGSIRGLHYQLNNPQGKLIYVVTGEIFDVAVDIRRGSPTFARWEGFHLSGENSHQVFIPEGFAHGFCVLSDWADVIYKCTDFYDPEDEYGIVWSDPAIAVEWPVRDPVISQKDRQYPPLKDIPENLLPTYRI